MGVMGKYLAAAENLVRFSASPAYKQLPAMQTDKDKFVEQWIGILRIPTSLSMTDTSVSMRRWYQAHTDLLRYGLDGLVLNDLSRIAVFRGFCQSGMYHFRRKDKRFPVFIPVSVTDKDGDMIKTIPLCVEDVPPANQFDRHIQYMNDWLKDYITALDLNSHDYEQVGYLSHDIGDNVIALIEYHSCTNDDMRISGMLDMAIDVTKKLKSQLTR